MLMRGCVRFCLSTRSSILEFYLVFVASKKLGANSWYGMTGSMELSTLDAKLHLVVLHCHTGTILVQKQVGRRQARCDHIPRPEPPHDV